MIFVDLDSTLNNLIEVWIQKLNNIENKNFTINDITKWDSIYKLYSNPNKILNLLYKLDVRPLKNADNFIKNLQLYDKVVILTDTDPNFYYIKTQWIDKYFKNIHFIFTNNNKYEYMNKNDIFIDDKFDAIYTSILKKDVYGFLFRNNDKYKYNDYLWDHYKFRRVNNYEEILKEVDKIYKRA